MVAGLNYAHTSKGVAVAAILKDLERSFSWKLSENIGLTMQQTTH